MRAAEGASIRNAVLRVTGALVAIGIGQEPGVGTCHSYWAVDEVEVAEGTAHAACRMRGGTGDLQLRLTDGSTIWYNAHHCRPWEPTDGEPIPAPLRRQRVSAQLPHQPRARRRPRARRQASTQLHPKAVPAAHERRSVKSECRHECGLKGLSLCVSKALKSGKGDGAVKGGAVK